MSGARRGTWAAAAVLATVGLAALAAPWLAPHDPAAQLDIVRLQNAAPSAAHPLGTDPLSRDVLSRLLHGARASVGVGLGAAAVATAIGTTWGLLAAAAGERAGEALMAATDALRAIPRIVVLLAMLLFLPSLSPVTLALLLGATSWMATSRLVHVQTRVVRAREFVAAAAALGASPMRVLLRHVAPHLRGTLVATSALLVADALALESTLSFLGLGVRPPDASWGSMVQDGVPYLASAWWVAGMPCVALVATVLAVSRLADAAHDGSSGPARIGHPQDRR